MRTALIWIAAVSALDAAYCVHDGSDFVVDEINPLVIYLMRIGGMPSLVAWKVLGTSLAIYGLQAMTYRDYRHRCMIVTVMCMVQALVVLSYIPRWLLWSTTF